MLLSRTQWHLETSNLSKGPRTLFSSFYWQNAEEGMFALHLRVLCMLLWSVLHRIARNALTHHCPIARWEVHQPRHLPDRVFRGGNPRQVTVDRPQAGTLVREAFLQTKVQLAWAFRPPIGLISQVWFTAAKGETFVISLTKATPRFFIQSMAIRGRHESSDRCVRRWYGDDSGNERRNHYHHITSSLWKVWYRFRLKRIKPRRYPQSIQLSYVHWKAWSC